MRTLYTAFIYIAFLHCASCKSGNHKNNGRDTSITTITSFNNLFLDSIKLAFFLQQNENYRRHEKLFTKFYRQRNYEYAWFDSNGPGEQAANFMNLLSNNISLMNDSSLYNSKLYTLIESFSADTKKEYASEDVLNTELMLTGQFFDYTAKIYKGTDSSLTDLGWFIPRKKIDMGAMLDTLLHTKSLAEFSNGSTAYRELQKHLQKYFQLQKTTTWDSIRKPEKAIHLKEQSPVVAAVREKLFLLGELPANDSSDILDSSLAAAIRRFQKHTGLGIDGTIGPKFITQLNVTPAERAQQILVNLERLRWMPDIKDTTYILVNIPEYKMYVYDSLKNNFTMNVVVGKAATSTVIFSGSLRTIVFSPYWKVPLSIVKNEIVPGIRKNPDYLAKHNMVRLGGSDTLPSIRQNPGSSNSLGRVKFLFPNSYDIYFHDTPQKGLFSASDRSFSHGCIRLGEPKKLAVFLLKNDTSWNDLRIDTSMNQQKEVYAQLKKQVPVYITYFTAWVDKDGELNFRKDIYGHDARLAEKLFLRKPQTEQAPLK